MNKTALHGVTCDIVFERLSAEGMISKEYIGTLSGAAVNQVFYSEKFPITWDAGEDGGITGEASGVGTDTIFETDLTAAIDYYNGMTIRFTSGGNSGELRIIDDYAQTNGQITVTVAFTGAPSASDAFIIEPSINVYTDDATPSTWTEYDEDGTDYIISAPTGQVTILAAENQGGNAGERISIDYYTTMTPGRGQSFEVGVKREILEVWELGSADPTDLVAGKKSISMSMDDLYIDASMFGWVIGESDFYQLPSDVTAYIYPNHNVIGQPYVKVTNIKFEGGTFSGDIDSLLGLGFTMKALAVDVGTVT